jgi:hypothetical protein
MGKPQRRFGKEFAAEAVRLVEVSGRTQREIDRCGGLRDPRRLERSLQKTAQRCGLVRATQRGATGDPGPWGCAVRGDEKRLSGLLLRPLWT